MRIHKDTAFFGLLGGLSSVQLLIYLFLCSLVDHFINCLMQISTKTPCRDSNPEADYSLSTTAETTHTQTRFLHFMKKIKVVRACITGSIGMKKECCGRLPGALLSVLNDF